MVDEIDVYKVGELISRSELEEIIGCTLSLKVCNDILGAHGFVRNRSSFNEWRRVAESSLEPYRRNEPVDAERLKVVCEGSTVIAWCEIVRLLGIHPSRASVNRAMEKDGWEWIARKHVWRKRHGEV